MSRSVRLAALVLAVAGSAAAQEALPLLPDILAQVQDSEVYLQGYLGAVPGGWRFDLPVRRDEGFPVRFEGDLATGPEGCDFAGVGPCRVDAYGYLEWDGPRLRVVMTSIETQGQPGVRTK
jgi:hypothetical protein